MENKKHACVEFSTLPECYVGPTTCFVFYVPASATVTIYVDDINDHSPQFSQKLYRATMSESFQKSTSVTSVSATDPDIGINAKLTYTLKEQDREFFFVMSVDATNTGVLKVFRVSQSINQSVSQPIN